MCREQNITGRTTPLLITIKKRLKVPGLCTFCSDRSEHEMGANVFQGIPMLFNYLTVFSPASCSDCLLVFVCSCTNTYWGKQSTWGRLQTPSSIWQHLYIWTLSDSEWELSERRQTVYRWIHSFQGLLYLAQMFATIHHAYVTWIATSRAPGKILIYIIYCRWLMCCSLQRQGFI